VISEVLTEELWIRDRIEDGDRARAAAIAWLKVLAEQATANQGELRRQRGARRYTGHLHVFRANDVGGELESVTVIDIDYQTAANDAMTLCVGNLRRLLKPVTGTRNLAALGHLAPSAFERR
jgi:hypothetical protein